MQLADRYFQEPTNAGPKHSDELQRYHGEPGVGHGPDEVWLRQPRAAWCARLLPVALISRTSPAPGCHESLGRYEFAQPARRQIALAFRLRADDIVATRAELAQTNKPRKTNKLDRNKVSGKGGVPPPFDSRRHRCYWRSRETYKIRDADWCSKRRGGYCYRSSPYQSLPICT